MHLFRCRVSKSVDGTPSIPSLLCKRGLPQYRDLGCRQQECPCAETGARHAATESLDGLCTDPKCDCDCNGHTPRNPETSVERPARLLVVPAPVTSPNVHTFRRFVTHLQRDASSLETQKRHSVQHFGQNLLQIAPDILDLVDSDAPVAFGADGLAHLPATARRGPTQPSRLHTFGSWTAVASIPCDALLIICPVFSPNASISHFSDLSINCAVVSTPLSRSFSVSDHPMPENSIEHRQTNRAMRRRRLEYRGGGRRRGRTRPRRPECGTARRVWPWTSPSWP